MKVTVKPTDLLPLIDDVLAETKPLADKRKIKIVLKKTGAIKTVLADDAKMKEVIMNLISNAVKYNRDNGYVEINLYPFDGGMMLEVHDKGYGIPKDQQDKIFQKFFRARTEKTEEVLGTGLGLFITRMLVEKMGGKITFNSIENQGSTFAVTMPGAK